MFLVFDWNPEKAESNLRKHGIRFEDAITAFDDPFAITEQDRFEDGEERWQLIGMSDTSLLVMVAYTEREGEGENGESWEVTRIISARNANRHERRRYEHHDGPVRTRYQ